MLNVANVTFGYDDAKPVLRGVSLNVPAGSIVGILGPNGSGKTTLLRLLAGTRHPQAGTITLDAAPLTSMSRVALARRMAVVPQETQLAFDYNVAEVAMMGRYAHLGPFEIEGPSDVEVVDEALASTGTLAFKDRLFTTLSGGEKQRVVIASALAQIFRLKPQTFRLKPEATGTDGGSRLQPDESGYLLLDEPTASLDLGYQLDVAALLQRLHQERGVTIVVSTHDLALASALCRRVLLIRDGVVLAEGTTDATLTPENLRRLYGVDVDVVQHASGRRVLVPTGRSAGA